MNQGLVNRIVGAVLYEGYILYPYRPSVKNHKRWTFGGIYPRRYSESQSGNDRWWMQTEGLTRGNSASRLQVSIRFLHLVDRLVLGVAKDERPGQVVDRIQVGDELYQTWQEAVEREVVVPEAEMGTLTQSPSRVEFRFVGKSELEPIPGPDGRTAAFVLREQEPASGMVEVEAKQLSTDLFQWQVRIENTGALEEIHHADREQALKRSLLSSHTILGVRDGEFVSLLEPPDDCREQAAACENLGTWPVLVGQPGYRDTMLSSPIFLYDYPEIASESPGDLFDATEIDEILSLRITTLTNEERKLAVSIDQRARAILERTDQLGQEEFLQLHGAMRGLRPLSSEDSP